VHVIVSAKEREETKRAQQILEKDSSSVILITDGAKRLGIARAYDIRKDGTVDWRKGAKLDRVCKKTSHRTLPPDLAPKAAP
jgi:hypothetical protein